ncbi:MULTISPECIES: restriction endonuclease [Rhizobium]|uniref:restriction endonuclease n=1 Tax=Rhizobium TaxID=379 RepID=UPI001A91EBD0|nr:MULTISPECIES: restriction endonuclease [Rhizobium]MBX5017525.1 restriction endonuclease [Rhizobium lentis]MBX5063466.1 restriction endonuclease [Rhizobium lentis]MBX5075572.1 restriction endonuclease [Rhizobium lentis]MBX5213050.1 restriction endonuclease [Rhizobium sp. NLR9a]QSW93217.1 restriction endonuclease [Rhizobium lentis]
MGAHAGKTSADFKGLEELVAKIQKTLAPQAEVLHNVKLDGHSSKRKRQIDVLVRDRIGQYEILIVIECKDYKSPVDVKGVEEFSGLVQDVRAQKGVLVCPRGFTKAAKQRAQSLQMDLYSPIDTDIHKWTARVTMPAICDFRSAAMSFGVAASSPYPFRLEYDFFKTSDVFDEEGASLGTPLAIASKKWSNGEFPTAIGEHEKVDIYSVKTFMDNGYGTRSPIDLWVGLRVTADLYFGQYPIAKLSGFKDEVAGSVIANAFELGMLDPHHVEKQWKKLRSIDEAPVEPVIVMTGLISWAD